MVSGGSAIPVLGVRVGDGVLVGVVVGVNVGVKVCVAVGVKVGVEVGVKVGVEVGIRGVALGLGNVEIYVGRGVLGRSTNPIKPKSKRQNSKPRAARIISCKYVIPNNLLLAPFEDGSIHEPLPAVYPAKSPPEYQRQPVFWLVIVRIYTKVK